MSGELRWPLHPIPKEGEALSSWIHRIATCYNMESSDLLKHDLACDTVDDLDMSPPLSLLIKLSERSGIGLDRLRCMSFAGWVPWLLDSLDDELPDALRTYALQFSVLLPSNESRPRPVKYWRAWLPISPISRACPVCLSYPEDQPLLLVWKLPLMLSCPLHCCWLESYRGPSGRFSSWEIVDCAPRAASDAIASMDRRTWQALTSGYVDLPRQRVHAGVWLRLLRTIVEELNTPLSQCDGYAKNVREVWAGIGQPLRSGHKIWRRFEYLGLNAQLRMLEAAAAAIEMVEAKMLDPCGHETRLFRSQSQGNLAGGVSDSNHVQNTMNAPWDFLGAAIGEAQSNLDAARFLFSLIAFRFLEDPDRQEEMRSILYNLGVPRNFLAHHVPTDPSGLFKSLRNGNKGVIFSDCFLLVREVLDMVRDVRASLAAENHGRPRADNG